MKRKKRISSLNFSSQQMVSYLPDECWECIFRFLNNNYDENLSSLSLVSKRFLSITNSLLFSLRVKAETRPFLPPLFKRFTNLNTLDLTHCYNDGDLNDLLIQISTFPLKLKSLKLPRGCRFPADGLQAFSQNITTLTSLTCSNMVLYDNNLLIIADCFPFLKQLNLDLPYVNDFTNFFNTIPRLLSNCPCIQHLDLRNTFLNDQHVDELSFFLVKIVSIDLSKCWSLTESAIFSLVRNCPSLGEIKMENTDIGKKSLRHSDSLVEFGVYPQLKSLYLGCNSWLYVETFILFASSFPNLQLLDLQHCHLISEGICQVLRKCCKLKHLNLTGCLSVKLHGMNFAVPELEVLNLSNTRVDYETLYMISKNCCGLLQLLLEKCKGVTVTGVKQVVENCTQLREIKLGRFRLSDKNRKLLSRHGCHLC